MALPQEEQGALALLRAFKDSALALLVPAVIIGGIVGGLFTPTEAGVVAVACVVIAGVFVYRTLDLPKIETALVNAAVTTTIVMLILGMTAVFANLLARARFQTHLITLLEAVSTDPTLQLLTIMAMLFVLGFVIDVT